MQGIIGIENFKISCIIGVNPDERTRVQEIFVDLKVRADVSRCIAKDRLKDAIDYTLLAKMCRDLAIAHRYHLMETYAAEVLSAMLQSDRIEWAWIRVKKPKGLLDASYTYCEMERSK